MRIVLGLILFLGAFVLLVVEFIALADPGALPASAGAGSSAPWYVHIFWLLVIGAMGWMAMRLLGDGPGRLVRGRGLTPVARR